MHASGTGGHVNSDHSLTIQTCHTTYQYARKVDFNIRINFSFGRVFIKVNKSRMSD